MRSGVLMVVYFVSCNVFCYYLGVSKCNQQQNMMILWFVRCFIFAFIDHSGFGQFSVIFRGCACALRVQKTLSDVLCYVAKTG